MKLETLTVKNFRCYKDEISIPFEKLTAIIAKNDIGKSSILEALDAFFNYDKLDSGDRSSGIAATDKIEISCTFGEIPDGLIIDTDNIISPAKEYLLNSNNKLQIKKVFSGATPQCEEVYIHAIHPTAEKFNDLFSLTIKDLKLRASELNIDLVNVNQKVKSALRHAIWLSVPEANLLKLATDLRIKDTIWKAIQNILPLFQLFKSDRPSSDQDAEAQDPIKFAIKEALKSKTAELDLIGHHVRSQVEEVTKLTIEKIKEMDPELASHLNPKFSSFNWNKVFSVSLTNEENIPLNKRGSGVRRLFLINFFRAKAEQLANEREVQDVIFAIEEPETSQHPNNQLIILEALKDLSTEKSSQVIFTTHNPVLAGKINRNSIRFIEKNEFGIRTQTEINESSLMRIKETLGMFANHNIKIFVGVEGPNDIEFLSGLSACLSSEDPSIKDLRKAELNGELVYIPMGGSTLELWTNRLEGLNVPEIHILDRDNPPPQAAKYQSAADRVNARGNHCISFITHKREMENYIHYEAINEEFSLALTQNHQDFDDVPMLIAKLVHETSGSPTPWNILDEDKKSKKESKAKKRLNRKAVLKMNLSRINQIDPQGEVISWLKQISSHLLP